MMLVTVGLLFGLIGLGWVMVLELICTDRQSRRSGSQQASRPVAEPVRPAFKAA